MVHNLGTPDWCRDEACQIGTQMRQPRSGAPNWNPDETPQIGAPTMPSNSVLIRTTLIHSQMGCPRIAPILYSPDWVQYGGARLVPRLAPN